jgi:hypothetical protein
MDLAPAFVVGSFVIHSGIRVSEFLGHSAFGFLVVSGSDQTRIPNAEGMAKPESPNECRMIKTRMTKLAKSLAVISIAD